MGKMKFQFSTTVRVPATGGDLTTRRNMNLDLNTLSSQDIINGLSNNKIREILLSLGPRLKGDTLDQIDDVVICPTGHFLLSSKSTKSGNKRPRSEEPEEPESFEDHIESEPIVEEPSESIVEPDVESETLHSESEELSPLEHCFQCQRDMENGGYEYIKESWRHQFIVAVDYVRNNGLLDINIPDTTTHTYKNMKRDVGSWIKHQRVAYREGKLTAYRKDVLELCGINWYKKQEHWESMFVLYQKYKEAHGEEPATTYTCDSGENLGEWVAIQRKEYLKGTLSQEHRTKLNQLGFVWKPRANAWNENYQKLVAFLSGNRNVLPVRHKTGTREEYGIDLSTWLSKQKEKISSGRITMQQEEKLRALPETARVFLNLFDA